MKRADRFVDLYWSLERQRVVVARRIYSALDRMATFDHDRLSLELPPTERDIGTAVLRLLSLHNVSRCSARELKAQAKTSGADDVLRLASSAPDAFFARGHAMVAWCGQPKHSPIQMGATITADFKAELQVLPRTTTPTELGAAIVAFWQRIVAARGLA